MLLKILRNASGLIIVAVDRLTRPKAASRSAEAQSAIEQSLSGHTLYQLFACPFCVKTRRAMHRLNIDLEIRDVGKNNQYRQQLEQGGGRIKVPCLRIDDGEDSRWMYESGDIIAYLEKRVTEAGA